jgi:hypothetical protein
MASQTAIVNHALDLLGETAINDISDATEPAERMLAAWDHTRDAALRGRWWRFAIERASLPADSSTPAWGFTTQYQIAGDVVRVIQVDQYWPAPVLSDYVGSDTSPYKIEGDKILTDITAPLKVRWIVNSVDVGLWDSLFARVMACDLAERLAPRLTGSETMLARINQQRAKAITEAVRVNALEQPPTMINDSSWIASRFAV